MPACRRCHADARLIAAAPDLLAALEEIVGNARTMGPGDFLAVSKVALDEARAAIARARGDK